MLGGKDTFMFRESFKRVLSELELWVLHTLLDLFNHLVAEFPQGLPDIFHVFLHNFCKHKELETLKQLTFEKGRQFE